MPSCSRTTWPRSAIPRPTRSPTSAGDCSRARAGRRWACTTARPRSAWTRGRTKATSCSRSAPTTRPAAAATRPATSTFRCASARCASTARTWCARARCCTAGRTTMHAEIKTYERQGFGTALPLKGPVGLLIVDFVNGFADPAVFGGGNIPAAIARTVPLLAAARERGWAIAHSRIVYADDGADHNIFSLKVPGMLGLKEHDANSAIVPELAPRAGELVVRKTVPSAFFGTSLAAWLAQRGVQTLVVAGAVTSGCVRASVVDAMSW